MAEKNFTLAQLAKYLNGKLEGPAELKITGVCDLSDATAEQISFVESSAYASALKKSQAGAVVVTPEIKPDRPAIIIDTPADAFIKLLDLFASETPKPPVGVHPSALIAESASVDKSVSIGANCVIGHNTTIGKNCIIYPNVYIGDSVVIGDDCVIWPSVVIRENVKIGYRVIIHPNVTIGADGFGYHFADGKHVKIKHIGTVIIEDDVEIGASTCIDRAKAGATHIGAGTKIDNLVQIGHNVKIGKNSIIVSQVGIAGSTEIGSYVIIGGQVGIADHITIGDRVRAAAQAGITRNIPAGTDVRGYPAIDNRTWTRQHIKLRKLPDKVDELTKRIDELEQSIHNKKRS